MKICVFCSAQEVDEKFIEPCSEVVKAFSANGDDLIWGGSNTGLMKYVADVAQDNGAKIYGVSVKMFEGVARKGADQMIFSADLGERKRLMLEKSDLFIVFPGGLGTLDEVAEIMELKKNAVHSKPIAFLNVDNYFDGLLGFFERMQNENMVKVKISDLVETFNRSEEMINFIDYFRESNSDPKGNSD